MTYQKLLPLALIGLIQACGPNPPAVSQSSPGGPPPAAVAAAAQPSGPIDKDTQTVASQPKASGDAFGLAENMTYTEARQKLIDQGWTPHTQGDPPNLRDQTVKFLFDRGYEEVKDCSGTGLGPCRFEFTNKAREILVISTISQGKRGPDRFVWRWFIEPQNSRSTAPSPSAHLPFVGKRAFNFLGGSGTGHTITIDRTGNTVIELNGTMSRSVLYRGPFREQMFYEGGGGVTIKDSYAIQCDRSSSDPSTEGAPPCKVKLYEVTAPNEPAAAKPPDLPFVGKRYFWYDGDRFAIIIEADGATTIKSIYSKMKDWTVHYRGPYRTEMPYRDGAFVLNLKIVDQNVQFFNAKGEVQPGCTESGLHCDLKLTE
jgi:hypothetical protein